MKTRILISFFILLFLAIFIFREDISGQACTVGRTTVTIYVPNVEEACDIHLEAYAQVHFWETGGSGDNFYRYADFNGVIVECLENAQGIYYTMQVVNPGCTVTAPCSSTISPFNQTCGYVFYGCELECYCDSPHDPCGNGEHKVKTATQNGIPAEFLLYQNFPNPFNPTTSITFDIPKPSIVRLNVYDVGGAEVAEIVNSIFEAGRYTYQFDASNYASGLYFYKIEAGDYTSIKKMVLMK